MNCYPTCGQTSDRNLEAVHAGSMEFEFVSVTGPSGNDRDTQSKVRAQAMRHYRWRQRTQYKATPSCTDSGTEIKYPVSRRKKSTKPRPAYSAKQVVRRTSIPQSPSDWPNETLDHFGSPAQVASIVDVCAQCMFSFLIQYPPHLKKAIVLQSC